MLSAIIWKTKGKGQIPNSTQTDVIKNLCEQLIFGISENAESTHQMYEYVQLNKSGW